METCKHIFQKLGIDALAAVLVVGMFTGLASANKGFVELIGTKVPADQKYTGGVYDFQVGDQKIFMRLSEFDDRSMALHSSNVNGFSYLRRNALKRFRVVGDKDTVSSLHAFQLCESVKVHAYLNYSTGLLRVIKLEPVKSDKLLSNCNF